MRTHNIPSFKETLKNIYRNNSIYWDPVCIGTPFVLEKIIILTIILIGTYYDFRKISIIL